MIDIQMIVECGRVQLVQRTKDLAGNVFREFNRLADSVATKA